MKLRQRLGRSPPGGCQRGPASAAVVVDFSKPQHRQRDECGAPALTIIGRLAGAGAGVPRPSGAALNPCGRLGAPSSACDHHLKQEDPNASALPMRWIWVTRLLLRPRPRPLLMAIEGLPGPPQREEVVEAAGGDPVSLKAWGACCAIRGRANSRSSTTGSHHSA